jgi:hypothetical protein
MKTKKIKIGDHIKLKWGQMVIVDEVYEDGSIRVGYYRYTQAHMAVDKKEGEAKAEV